ncbi:hypothetical protein KVT40_009218 [Elsinoe batatas]|uniref:Uncharacterized protein n=1 Tax=Elsinoe batatas TaxID=2601811 RepID=A0A8K0KS69_9PEZI|nr:hypothetical protein KVT40_009218 [Elsinoe batatas]
MARGRDSLIKYHILEKDSNPAATLQRELGQLSPSKQTDSLTRAFETLRSRQIQRNKVHESIPAAVDILLYQEVKNRHLLPSLRNAGLLSDSLEKFLERGLSMFVADSSHQELQSTEEQEHERVQKGVGQSVTRSYQQDPKSIKDKNSRPRVSDGRPDPVRKADAPKLLQMIRRQRDWDDFPACIPERYRPIARSNQANPACYGIVILRSFLQIAKCWDVAAAVSIFEERASSGKVRLTSVALSDVARQARSGTLDDAREQSEGRGDSSGIPVEQTGRGGSRHHNLTVDEREEDTASDDLDCYDSANDDEPPLEASSKSCDKCIDTPASTDTRYDHEVTSSPCPSVEVGRGESGESVPSPEESTFQLPDMSILSETGDLNSHNDMVENQEPDLQGYDEHLGDIWCGGIGHPTPGLTRRTPDARVTKSPGVLRVSNVVPTDDTSSRRAAFFPATTSRATPLLRRKRSREVVTEAGADRVVIERELKRLMTEDPSVVDHLVKNLISKGHTFPRATTETSDKAELHRPSSRRDSAIMSEFETASRSTESVGMTRPPPLQKLLSEDVYHNAWQTTPIRSQTSPPQAKAYPEASTLSASSPNTTTTARGLPSSILEDALGMGQELAQLGQSRIACQDSRKALEVKAEHQKRQLQSLTTKITSHDSSIASLSQLENATGDPDITRLVEKYRKERDGFAHDEARLQHSIHVDDEHIRQLQKKDLEDLERLDEFLAWCDRVEAMKRILSSLRTPSR